MYILALELDLVFLLFHFVLLFLIFHFQLNIEYGF